MSAPEPAAAERYLIDENCSPGLATDLRSRGVDAVHVNEIGMRSTHDEVIFHRAAQEGRTIITHDHDYVRLHEDLGSTRPSVIKLAQRDGHGLVGTDAIRVRLADVLPGLRPHLDRGAVVHLDRARCDHDPLPLERGRTVADRTVADRVVARAAERATREPPALGRSR